MKYIYLLIFAFCHLANANNEMTVAQKKKLLDQSHSKFLKFKTVGEMLDSNGDYIELKKMMSKHKIDSLPMPKINRSSDFVFMFDWGKTILKMDVTLENHDARFVVNGKSILIHSKTTMTDLVNMNIKALPKLVGIHPMSFFLPEAHAYEYAQCMNAGCAEAVANLIAFELDIKNRFECDWAAIRLEFLKSRYDNYLLFLEKPGHQELQYDLRNKLTKASKELSGIVKDYFDRTEKGECGIPPITLKNAMLIIDKFSEKTITPTQEKIR